MKIQESGTLSRVLVRFLVGGFSCYIAVIGNLKK